MKPVYMVYEIKEVFNHDLQEYIEVLSWEMPFGDEERAKDHIKTILTKGGSKYTIIKEYSK